MIICIVGPTGIGKTRLSIALAQKYNAIIVNADAMQVYQQLNIGTAKIKESEKEGIPHFLFDIASPQINYTVYNYQKDARQIIKANQDKNIIFVGGSGLYLRAALFNYVFSSSQTTNNYEDYSTEELYNLALKKDPNLLIHPHNRQRLVRFLNKENIEEEKCYPLYPALFIGLTTTREKLYDRINKRVEEMFAEGLVEEVSSLLPYFPSSKALNTAIGYKEVYKYLNNELTLEETKELIKKNSRHYAKRQYTFFNHQFNVKWFDVDFNDFSQTIAEVTKYIDNQN